MRRRPIVYLALVGGLAGFGAYIYALAHLPVSFVSLYAYINPVIAVALGTLVLGEPFTSRMVVAIAIILAGTAIVSLAPNHALPLARARTGRSLEGHEPRPRYPACDMSELPRISDLTADAQGVGFYLCAKKEERQTRTGGAFLRLTLRDRTGEVRATMFDDVEKYQQEFEQEDFVKIEARSRIVPGPPGVARLAHPAGAAGRRSVAGVPRGGLPAGVTAQRGRDVAGTGGPHRRRP